MPLFMMDLNKMIAKQSKKSDSAEDETKKVEETATAEEPEDYTAAVQNDEHATEQEKENAARPLADWGPELERRVKACNSKDNRGGTREDEGDVRNKFWEEFFKAKWKPEVAKQLLTIKLLRKDIETMGFDPLMNPVLAFLIRPFAQKLAAEGLLNTSTYLGIHNAIAKNYLADSEFVKENDYNILYSRDLYTKQTVDITDYFRRQSVILPKSAPKYSAQSRTLNVKVFLQNGVANMRDSNAKLNSFADIDRIHPACKNGGSDSSQGNSNGSGDSTGGKSKDRDELIQIVKELSGDITKLLVALQFVSMKTSSDYAAKALKGTDFGTVSGEKIVAATNFVAKLLSDVKFDSGTTRNFVDLVSDAVEGAAKQ